jgi:hypothetical protein
VFFTSALLGFHGHQQQKSNLRSALPSSPVFLGNIYAGRGYGNHPLGSEGDNQKQKKGSVLYDFNIVRNTSFKTRATASKKKDISEKESRKVKTQQKNKVESKCIVTSHRTKEKHCIMQHDISPFFPYFRASSGDRGHPKHLC